MITGKELIEKQFSSYIGGQEDKGERIYKNGSLHVIHDGSILRDNDFNNNLGEDLINAIDKLFENCSDLPLDIDIIINVREK